VRVTRWLLPFRGKCRANSQNTKFLKKWNYTTMLGDKGRHLCRESFAPVMSWFLRLKGTIAHNLSFYFKSTGGPRLDQVEQIRFK
jgi:hypothetical protein